MYTRPAASNNDIRLSRSPSHRVKIPARRHIYTYICIMRDPTPVYDRPIAISRRHEFQSPGPLSINSRDEIPGTD